MNERIRELAEQAGYKPLGTFADELMEIYNKKFAELIVRECMSTLETKIDEGDGYGPYENGAYHGLIRARNIIKKHFGVE